MCGISGFAYANPEQLPDPALLRAMTETLRHRGPDGEGYHLGSGVGLGFRRLSIIDLETGDQPIASEDGSVIVVCNGEIYNYVELRRELQARGHTFRSRTDVEVIVHLYEEVGRECVEQLRGMFGLAIWDGKRRTLLLARDRFGIKPLYYAEAQGALFFGSEQKAILASGTVSRQICYRGLQDLLTKGFVVAPSTMLSGIRQLEPGTLLTYREGASSVHTYWDAVFAPRAELERRTEVEWTEMLREKLDETVRMHLRSDVPVGAWLSAGIDSSAIVALMSRYQSDPIHTVTLGFDNPVYDEIRNQRTLLDYPEFRLTGRVAFCGSGDFARFAEAIWFTEDPSSTGIEVVRTILAPLTAENVKVVLTGEGADEILAGYTRFRLDKLMRPLSWLPASVRRLSLLGDILPRRFRRASRMFVAPRRIRMPRYVSTLAGPTPEGLDRMLSPAVKAELSAKDYGWDLVLPDSFDRWPPLSQMQYYESKVRLPSLILNSLDRGTMQHSVEARVPFLDHELFELTAAMPPRLKLRGLHEKHVLREAVRPLLPPEIVSRRKRGLNPPIDQWMREALPSFAAELLSSRSLKKAGYFNPSGVAALLEEHRTGARDWAIELMTVLGVQVWDSLFIRNEPL